MRYIVIPLLKFLYACPTIVVMAIVAIILNIISLIWNFKIEKFEKGFWEMDTNPKWSEGTSRWEKERVYPTIFHWLFNGNFKDFH